MSKMKKSKKKNKQVQEMINQLFRPNIEMLAESEDDPRGERIKKLLDQMNVIATDPGPRDWLDFEPIQCLDNQAEKPSSEYPFFRGIWMRPKSVIRPIEPAATIADEQKWDQFTKKELFEALSLFAYKYHLLYQIIYRAVNVGFIGGYKMRMDRYYQDTPEVEIDISGPGRSPRS